MLTPQYGVALANAIVDTVRDPLVVLDQKLRVITASRSFYNTFRLARDDVHGLLLYEIDGGQWDIPELRELLGAISTAQATVEGYEVDREFSRIGRRIMLLNARKVFYETGTHSTILLAFEDVTSQRAIERQVQDLLHEKDMLLEEMEHRVASTVAIKGENLTRSPSLQIWSISGGIALRNTMRKFCASGPYCSSSRSRRMMLAVICLISVLFASYELLADAISKPSTRAAIVPMRPVLSFMTSLTSSRR